MTTEHVSVPRELAERLRYEFSDLIDKSEAEDKFAIIALAELIDILSRATPSDDKTSAPRVVTDREPTGTFECPVCGFDKPHHHGENDRFPWHMKYRATFEDIVHKNIRAVGGGVMRQYVYGRSGVITIRPGQYLAYDGRRARDTAKQHDQAGAEWSAFSKGTPFNGGYEHEWLDDLWNIFKQTVTALESFANSLPAAIPPGYVVVPVEPTDRMIDAAERLWTSEEIYKAMLASAPQAGERG